MCLLPAKRSVLGAGRLPGGVYESGCWVISAGNEPGSCVCTDIEHQYEVKQMGFWVRKIDKRIASYQQELLETHYREVDNMYRQIRGWRHDYRNHIQTMKAYAASENWDAIKRYLDLLDDDLTTVDTALL